MLLFSTKLKVNDKLTKDAFVRLVIEWNQTSKYEDNIIPGIEWNGDYNVSYVYENLKLEFVEIPDRYVIATRYVKQTEDGVIWNSDYILNLSERNICIQLDRSYMENASHMDQKFSTPHFISMLITQGYLLPDHGLKIGRRPGMIRLAMVEQFQEILYGNGSYQLPIVYVSRTIRNHLPVDVVTLAYRLKGVAHVAVAESYQVSSQLHDYSERFETNGDIGIYYRNHMHSHKMYRYRDYKGKDKVLLERIVSGIIKNENSKEIHPIYTWNGVNRELLNERLAKLHEEKAKAQADYQKDKIDNDELIEIYEEEIRTLNQQLQDYYSLSNPMGQAYQGAKTDSGKSSALPVLSYGAEKDMYPGEIRDLILRILKEVRKNTLDGSRRAHILDDLIVSNHYEAQSEKLEKMVKDLFRGYKSMDGAMRQKIKELGFTITEDGSHYKLTYHNDNRYMFTIAKTGSDYREGKNIAQTIIRTVC